MFTNFVTSYIFIVQCKFMDVVHEIYKYVWLIFVLYNNSCRYHMWTNEYDNLTHIQVNFKILIFLAY